MNFSQLKIMNKLKIITGLEALYFDHLKGKEFDKIFINRIKAGDEVLLTFETKDSIRIEVKDGGLEITLKGEDDVVRYLKHGEKQFFIRTKKIDTYFTGKIVHGVFPFESGKWFYIECLSYAGGSAPTLELTDYKEKDEEKLIKKVKEFCKKHKLITDLKF